MPYRPQFAYPSPPPSIIEEDFLAYFDPTIVPILGQNLSGGQAVNDIPLQFQRDAAFSIRGIKLNAVCSNLLGIAFKDAYGNTLSESDIFISSTSYESNPQAAYPGATPVVFEPQLENPAGATMFISFQNLGATTATLSIAFTFFGIKRYPAGTKMQNCERR